MFKKIFAVSACVITMTACQPIAKVSKVLDYSVGVNISSVKMLAFVDKKTTKSDVIKSVGQPGLKFEVDGGEVWSYGYTYIPGVPFMGKKNLSETTVFEFDKRGVLVQQYKTDASPQSAVLLDVADL